MTADLSRFKLGPAREEPVERTLVEFSHCSLPAYDPAKEMELLRAMTDEEWLRIRISGLEEQARWLRGCSYFGVSPAGASMMEATRLRAILHRLENER